MRDDPTSRQMAIRYWERRRPIYNLALVPPALLGYLLTSGILYAGDPHETHYWLLLLLFGLSALGANICYSFAYALEFLFGNDDETSKWIRWGRTTSFAGGIVFAMLLALAGGWNIAQFEFSNQFHHAA